MTFLFPGFLIAAGAIALGVVALHFLVTRQPRSETLPTVRFVPDLPVRSTAIAIRASDLWLLLLRVLMILLIGAAFAQPQITPRHRTVARVVVVDVSRSVGDIAALADSAQRYASGARAVIVFDSTTRDVSGAHAADSLRALAGATQGRTGHRGSLSSALIAAYRAAAHARAGVDSLELVIISPFVAEERDAATDSIRALWPGHIALVHVAGATASTDTMSGAPRRTRVQWADSAKSGTDGTIWTLRSHVDTVAAVRAGSAVLVYPFVRRWQLAAPLDSTMRVYARWVDGTPAAVERIADGVCTRSLAFAVPTAGDAMLRPAFTRFLDDVAAPCGAERNFAPLSSELLAQFAGPANRVPVAKIKPPITRMTSWVPWLLGAALLLALLELLVRRMGARRTARDDVESQVPDAPQVLNTRRAAGSAR